MRIFEIIKENVNLREAAELYGIDVNRYGKALEMKICHQLTRRGS